MEYKTLDEQIRQKGRQENAKEVYKRLLAEGIPEEKAYYLAYGTSKKKD